MDGCQAIGTVSQSDNTHATRIQEMVDTLVKLKTQHSEMQQVETQMAASMPGQDWVARKGQLHKLRQQRVQCPRILCCHGVSNYTGQGLPALRKKLEVLMEDTRLFGHVGAKVPLNYSMLERLAYEGRAQADQGEKYEIDAETDRANWEQAVTKHVASCANDRLREACSHPYVSLSTLEEAALEVGMNKAEVRSALLLLHATGSMLHYANDTRRSNQVLQRYVFMQPQFIIDAIKYVIREPCAAEVNDETRALDVRIRRDPGNSEALDRFLGIGTENAHSSGVLTRHLLTHLWRHLNPQHHTVLLELMKAFKLLRPLTDKDTFLVPAMLPQCALPDEYVTPYWWRPSKAAAVAIIQVEDVAHRGEMRIMYTVLGGRLPFGFMSELQVRLAERQKSGDKKQHFAPEATVVDRIAGSVLSAAYTCGGGKTKEWVVLSRPLALAEQGHGEQQVPVAADCICIMGWVTLLSKEGATDWRVFRMVIKEIEQMWDEAPGLSLRKLVFFVDAGQVSRPLDITNRLHTTVDPCDLLTFEFDDDSKDAEDVDPDLVLPSLSETRLSRPQQLSHQPAAPESALHRIAVFFTNRTYDYQLGMHVNVHAEAQLIARTVLNPDRGWDCSTNLQPTIEDFYTSIEFARQCNVRVLHLAGHGRKECGFIWNASDAATVGKEFDIHAISMLIGSVAGKDGPMECVVLNACSTEKMGRLLLQRGVPCVICWRTQVQDETAKELCERFYRALVENASGLRDYRRAFLVAADGMQSSRHTGGVVYRPPGALDMNDRHDKSLLSGNVPSSTSRVVGGSNRQGPVLLEHQEDVVLFLSNDGDSRPIYLCRERQALPITAPPGAPPQESGATEEVCDAGLKALFQQYGLCALCVDVCRELGVHAVDDLALVTQDDLDDLPNYLKHKLKPVQKRKLTDLLGLQPISTPGKFEQSSKLAVAAEQQASLASGNSRGKPCIMGFFAKKRTVELDIHREAQNMQDIFLDVRHSFEIIDNPQPTFEHFQNAIRYARQRNVRIVHLAGHGRIPWGFLWLEDSSANGYAQVPIDQFAKVFTAEASESTWKGTVECVVLNACETEAAGKRLRDHNIPHVICWRTAVKDETATDFVTKFYKSLDLYHNAPQGYKIAFQQAFDQMAVIDVSCAAIDVVRFLSKDGDLPEDDVTQPVQRLPLHLHIPNASTSQHVRSDLIQAGSLTVSLSKQYAEDVPIELRHTLLREFASWSPGPVLFNQGEKVKLLPSADFRHYHGRIGTVVKHLIGTAHLVRVELDEDGGESSETLDVLSSIVHSTSQDKSGVARTKRMLGVVQMLQTSLDSHLASGAAEHISTMIGYSELKSADRLEREYWIALSPLTLPLRDIASGQLEHNLMVMHVEYDPNSSRGDPSHAVRASLRLTQSVVPRAHQDKCRVCAECTKRRICTNCLTLGNKFAKNAICDTCRNCDHCINFKWASTYGILSPPPAAPSKIAGLPLEVLKQILDKCESKCDPSLMFSSSLDDYRSRRFAFVLGNNRYTSNDMQSLENCIDGAEFIAEHVKIFGFQLYSGSVLANQTKEEIEREFDKWACMLPHDAVAFVYIAAHGMELDGERYLVPVDYEHSDDDIAKHADAVCVSLSWMRERLNRVMRHTGLILSFWDCCRENEKKHKPLEMIVRAEANALSSLNLTQEAFKKECEKLATAAGLHGGHCHKWMQSWADLQALVSRAQLQTVSAGSVLRKPDLFINNDALIFGLADMKTLIQKFTPSDWPGWIAVSASMPASLVLDSGQGGQSPLVQAMCEWFADPQLVQRHVLDAAVTNHITNRVQHLSDRDQRAEWTFSGQTDFRFVECDSDDMEI